MLNLAYGYVSLLNQTNYFDIILSSDILKTSIIPETINWKGNGIKYKPSKQHNI